VKVGECGGRGGGHWDRASHGHDVGPSHLRVRGSHDCYYIEYYPYWDSQLGHSHRILNISNFAPYWAIPTVLVS
jgi:hypothetical protein